MQAANGSVRAPPDPSPWAPLQQRVFRLPNAATLVALVQTADTLPDVVLAFPAGALADALDRRRLLIGLQLFQVVAGAALTGLTIAGQITPQEKFLASIRALRLSRLRTGAIRWGLYRDGATPNRFVEAYTVLSWDEHLRQHREDRSWS